MKKLLIFLIVLSWAGICQAQEGAFGHATLKGATSDGDTIRTTIPVRVGGYLNVQGNIRQPASAYHSYGTTVGSGGYGIRDNAGTMQYKNSGGGWADIATAAGSAGGWTDDGTTVRLTTASDNVGIGTTGPDGVLEINMGTNKQVRLSYNDGDGSATDYCKFEVADDGQLTISTVDADASEADIVLSPDGDVIVPNNLGMVIGAATKQAFGGVTCELQVLGTAAADASMGIGRWTAGTSAPKMNFVKSRGGTIGSNTIVQNNDEVGILGFYADDGTDYVTPVASIEIEVDGVPGGNDMPGRIIFSTTADNANTVTEAMRITNAQYVGIKTTAPGGPLEINMGTSGQFILGYNDGDGSPANKAVFTLSSAGALTLTTTDASAAAANFNLALDGNFVVNDAGADRDMLVETDNADSAFVLDGATGSTFLEGVGNHAAGAGTDLVIVANTDEIVKKASSKRFKGNIKDWSPNLNDFWKLKPRSYVWNKKSAVPGKLGYGLIAEEVGEVLPEAIIYNYGEVESFDTEVVLAYLVAKIQRQDEQIRKLEVEVAKSKKGTTK